MERKDVFISYSRTNSASAKRLKASLEEAGIRCWMDTEDMGGGQWRPQLRESIAQSRVVIVLASEASLARPEVRKEIEFADGKDVEDGKGVKVPLCWVAVDDEAHDWLTNPRRGYDLHNPDDHVLYLAKDHAEIVGYLRGQVHAIPEVTRWAAQETERGTVILLPGQDGELVLSAPGALPPLGRDSARGGPVLVDGGHLAITTSSAGVHVTELTTDGRTHPLRRTYAATGLTGILAATHTGVITVLATDPQGLGYYRLSGDNAERVQQALKVQHPHGVRSAALATGHEVLITNALSLVEDTRFIGAGAANGARWIDVDAASNRKSTLFALLRYGESTQVLQLTRIFEGRTTHHEVPMKRRYDSVRVARTPAWGITEPHLILLRTADSVVQRDLAELVEQDG